MPLLAAESARDNFVDLDVSMGWWVGLAVAIAVLLAVDLYRHRDDHEPTTRSALIETLVWVAFGVGFSAVIAVGFGGGAFGEYISGYLIEKSLSIDNAVYDTHLDVYKRKAEDWEQPVKDWVEPIGHVASAVEVGADAIIDRLPMATYETIEEQLAALETQISRQKQLRHVEGTVDHGGYVADQAAAQRVLDAVHDGSAELLGRTRTGHLVVRVEDVIGTNVNAAVAGPQATDVFMVKGTAHPSVVPTNPNWSPDE